MEITFRIDAKPVPKMRARVVGGHAFTPAETRDWETTVGWHARKAMCGRKPFQDDVCLTVKLGGTRADLSNLIKSIEDGMNRIVFEDDSQVVETHAYLTRKRPAFVEVTVNSID